MSRTDMGDGFLVARLPCWRARGRCRPQGIAQVDTLDWKVEEEKKEKVWGPGEGSDHEITCWVFTLSIPVPTVVSETPSDLDGALGKQNLGNNEFGL